MCVNGTTALQQREWWEEFHIYVASYMHVLSTVRHYGSGTCGEKSVIYRLVVRGMCGRHYGTTAAGVVERM